MPYKKIKIAGQECLITPEGEDLARTVDIEYFLKRPQELKLFRSLGKGVETRSGGIYDISRMSIGPTVAKWSPTFNTSKSQLEALCYIRENHEIPFTAPKSYIAGEKILIREKYPSNRQLPRILQKIEKQYKKNKSWLQILNELIDETSQPIDAQFQFMNYFSALCRDNADLIPKLNFFEFLCLKNWFVVGEIPWDYLIQEDQIVFGNLNLSCSDPRWKE